MTIGDIYTDCIGVNTLTGCFEPETRTCRKLRVYFICAINALRVRATTPTASRTMSLMSACTPGMTRPSHSSVRNWSIASGNCSRPFFLDTSGSRLSSSEGGARKVETASTVRPSTQREDGACPLPAHARYIGQGISARPGGESVDAPLLGARRAFHRIPCDSRTSTARSFSRVSLRFIRSSSSTRSSRLVSSRLLPSLARIALRLLPHPLLVLGHVLLPAATHPSASIHRKGRIRTYLHIPARIHPA